MTRHPTRGPSIWLLMAAATLIAWSPSVQALEWNWESPLPQGNHIYGCWGTSGSNIFVVGDFGAIHHFNGNRWSKQTTGTWYTLHDVWGTGPSNVWAVGNAGLILHSDGGGWTEVFHSSLDLTALWGNAPDDIYAVGRQGAVVRYGETPLIFNDGFETGNSSAWSASVPGK